jgi:hypothetical protein
VAPFRAMAASANRLSGNDVREFNVSAAHAQFDHGSANNICSGNHGLIKVFDFGTGNRCP